MSMERVSRASADQPGALSAPRRRRGGGRGDGWAGVLVFTGGVGENAPTVRTLAADGLGFLGVQVDPERNAVARGDDEIGADGTRARTLVIAAREDVQIAREVGRVLGR